MKGTKSKPLAELVASGSKHAKKRRAAMAVKVVPPDSVPPHPLGEIGLPLWDQLYALLTAHGVLDKTDAEVLYRYCDTVERQVRAADFVRLHGETMEVREACRRCKGSGKSKPRAECVSCAGSGYVVLKRVPHHESRLLKDLYGPLCYMEQQLGLTPYSRQRVRPHPAPAVPTAAGNGERKGLDRFV
ncbi:MAG: P27 family phage terminase small subunit [Candidatus Nanopelagicales bacterium]|nr:P27 family phage terminase small subunit [Candidatus Nanopelagicales bacterium]